MCLANETLCAFIMLRAPLSLASSVKRLAFYSCAALPRCCCRRQTLALFRLAVYLFYYNKTLYAIQKKIDTQKSRQQTEMEHKRTNLVTEC